MKAYLSPLMLAVLGLVSTLAGAAVDTSQWKCETCPYPKGISGTVDAGVGAVSDDSQTFGDYTGLQRKGAHAVLGGELIVRGGNGYYADLLASDLGLRTRSLLAHSGREGLYSLNLGYSELPRHLADGARTPFLGNGGSVLTLPAGFPSASTATMPLAATLQDLSLGATRKRFELAGAFVGGERFTYRVSLRRDVRDGTQPGAASFFNSAAQLAVPVDQVTDQLEVSASYASRQWQAMLAYQISQFRNDSPSLAWANPFPAVVAGATRGQLALAPDNQFHQVLGSAAYQITPTIRASADFAAGRGTQNEAFLPTTANATLGAAVPALPRASLDGRVDTFNGGVKLSAAPIDGLRLLASYNHDVRDNRTGVAGWAQVATDIFVDTKARANTPFSLIQDRYKLQGDYRGPGSWKLAAGIERDDRNRSYQEVADTKETTVWARAAARPIDGVSLALKLAHAERTTSTYGTATWFGLPENPLLRKYNLAARKRDSTGVRADWTVNDKLALGATLDAAEDRYDATQVGLRSGRSESLGVDLSYAMSEQTQFTLFAQAERARANQAGSETHALPDWTARHADRFEVLGASVKHAAIPDKLDIGAELSVARSRSDVTVETALAEPLFPGARTSIDSIKLHASYKLQDNLWLNASWWYERYDASDWRLDGVLPGTVFNLLAFGNQAPRYKVNVLRVALRYRF